MAIVISPNVALGLCAAGATAAVIYGGQWVARRYPDAVSMAVDRIREAAYGKTAKVEKSLGKAVGKARARAKVKSKRKLATV
jgi:hypothetical protein